MRSISEGGTRGAAFWLIVVASTLGNIVNSSNSPIIARIVGAELPGDDALAGMLVSLSAFASIAAMPLAGAAADRWSVRPVLIAASVIAIAGLVLVASALTVPTLAASRIIVGAGNAAVATALTAWVVAEIPHRERGRALGLFGLSVWVGLALGPPLGDALYREIGQQSVWIASAALQLTGLLIALLVRTRGPVKVDTGAIPMQAPAEGLRGWLVILRAVAVPGGVALAAWASEAFMIAFLLQHLSRNGVASEGIFGAANVFTIFAVSVVTARLLLSNLTDRLGPVVVTRWALVMVAAGMLTLAVSESFAVAALGGMLVGIGYSPLYPALTMLATEHLHPRRRSTGLGVFAALTSVGHALGSLLGGFFILLMGEAWSFATLAAVLLLAILLLRDRRRPRLR
ncbi:MFS transporter [Salinibacterium sp. SYSU T00001]|uniref:MFS transporter n=1 Tax=Homoserinimonas sedimenticola TaxID=2986805 RepID=UPI002235A24A|nr:MFS transporter [Salinibacterium sedimenticola]MCW4385079.1 MFS transporter [Salinibacterium sedimenticola]